MAFAKRKLLLALLAAAAALAALYALAGFLLVPRLIERHLPALASRHIDGTLVVERAAFNPFLLQAGGQVRLSNARGEEVLSIARLSADLQWSSLWQRRWTFESIRIEQPRLQLRKMSDGSLDVAGIIKPAPQSSRTSAPLPSVFVRDIALVEGSTAVGAGGGLFVEPVALSIADLSTAPGASMTYTLTAVLRGGGSLASKGELSLAPLASRGDLRIAGLPLAGVWPWVREQFALDTPRGTADVTGRYSFAQGSLALADTRIALKDLVLAKPREQPLLRLAAASADGITVELRSRRVELASLALRGGTARFAIAANGALNWDVVRPSPAKEARPEGWTIRIPAARVDQVAISFTDAARADPLAVEGHLGSATFGLATTTNGRASGVTVERLDARLNALSLTSTQARVPILRFDAAMLGGGSLSTRERRLSVDAITLAGGGAQIVRNDAGRIDLVDRLLGPAAPAGASATEAEADAQPWRIALGSVGLEGFELGVSDRSFGAPIAYDVGVSALRLSSIGGENGEPIGFEAALRVGAQGRVAAHGTWAQDGAGATVKLDIADLQLAPLAPLVARHAALDFRGGLLSGSATAQVRGGAAPGWTAQGRFDVAQVLFNEAGSDRRFLAWKLLKADAVRYASAENRLSIGSVVVREPGAKLEISRERDVNVLQVLRGGKAADARSTSAEPGRPFAYRIDRLGVVDGVLDFADYSLALPFATQVQSLAGGLTGLSSEPGARARVSVEGRIEPYGSARARGTIAIAAPTQHTDIRAQFENVPMPPLSPYSVTFAGRRIDGGQLWVDARYAIDKRVLTGSNDIRIADLRLGERVESKTALDLPLDLAIALLTDERGRIEVAVPVSGDLDNPSFGYAKVIGEALLNIVKRAITAPFRLLGRLVGAGGSEGLEAIEFEPGRARLRPPEEEKLNQVAAALRERPRLKLVVPAPYDPEHDARALARQRLRAALRQRAGEAEQGDAAPVAFGSAGTQKELEKMFVERAGREAFDAFVREFEQRAARKDERAGPPRTGSDTEFYEALFRKLAETERVGDDALQALARERADAIVGYLTRRAEADATRIEIGGVQADRADPSREVIARLALRPIDGRS